MEVDDRVDALGGEAVDGLGDPVEVGLVVLAGLGLDPRPRQQQAHRVPADRGHARRVAAAERERGREVVPRPVLGERVDVDAAQQDLAAAGVDDAPAGLRIGLGVQCGQPGTGDGTCGRHRACDGDAGARDDHREPDDNGLHPRVTSGL